MTTPRGARWRAPGHVPPAEPMAAAHSEIPPTPDERGLALAVLEKISQLPAMLRQTLLDQQWASIPFHVMEYGAAPAQAANVPLPAPPMTQGLEQIETVVACVPPGAVGVLQLGPIVLYLPAGVTSLGGQHILLEGTMTRSLTCTAAGPAALLLTGMQLPTHGQAPA